MSICTGKIGYRTPIDGSHTGLPLPRGFPVAAGANIGTDGIRLGRRAIHSFGIIFGPDPDNCIAERALCLKRKDPTLPDARPSG